jgi:hypothetical protein
MGAGAAVALAVAATLALAATPASAHFPKVDAFCDQEGTTLDIKLSNYKTGGDNTLTVIADDKTIVDEKVFGTSFANKWTTFDPKVEHEFVVEVVAWDDPDGAKGWSISEKLDVEACAAAATTTQAAAPKAPHATTPPVTTPPVTTPGGANQGGLAETGVSILIPIVLGVLMLVGGVALLFLVRRRGDRGARPTL